MSYGLELYDSLGAKRLTIDDSLLRRYDFFEGTVTFNKVWNTNGYASWGADAPLLRTITVTSAGSSALLPNVSVISSFRVYTTNFVCDRGVNGLQYFGVPSASQNVTNLFVSDYTITNDVITLSIGANVITWNTIYYLYQGIDNNIGSFDMIYYGVFKLDYSIKVYRF